MVDGRIRRAAHLRPLQRRAGRRLLGVARQGRERRLGRRGGREEDRRAAPGPSEHALRRHRQHGAVHGRQLRIGDAHADRGCAARGAGRVPVPEGLARDPDLGGRHPALGASDLLGHGRARLLAQPREPPRHHARHRHPGRRRHRRDREHRPPHQDGEVALPRLARGGRRDRPCGHRHHLHDHRGVRAGELHGRHRRPVLQAVRHHGRGGGAVLASRRASYHADARRLFHARQGARGAEGRRHHARLYRARRLVGAAQISDLPARHRVLRGLDLLDEAPPQRLPAGGRRGPLPLRRRAAARIAPRRHQGGDRPACGASARDAGSALRLRQRRRAAAGQEGGAPGDLHGRLCAEVRARASAAPARGAHHRHVPGRAGYPLRHAQRQRPAGAAADRQRARPEPRHRDGGEAAARDGDDRPPLEPAVHRAAEPPRDPHPAKARGCGGARRFDRRHRRDGAGRNHRRHRREPRQVRCRRPAGADPGAAARERARRPSAARASQGAGEERRRGAALRRRRRRARAGADLDRSLRPRPARRARGGSERHRRARRGPGRRSSRCRRRRTCRPASRSSRPATPRS